jgi:hypothetical protein
VVQGLGEQREHAVGERSELPLSSGSCAPWSSFNNCTEGSKSGVKGSTLAKELSRMGLDASNAALLQHGSIINAGGQYVRLVSDRLVVTRRWPGATGAPAHCSKQMLRAVDAEVEKAFDDAEALRQEQLRMRVRSAVLTHGSLAFGKNLSDADFEIAFDELRKSIDWVTDAAINPPSSEEVREFLPSMKPHIKALAMEERADEQ